MEDAAVLEFTTDMIRVTTSYGHRSIEALRCGQYAVHRRFVDGLPDGEGWAVTHCYSGLLIWSTQDQQGACRAALWLAEHTPLVDTDATTLLSMRTVAADTLEQIRTALQQIAPRWPTHSSHSP